MGGFLGGEALYKHKNELKFNSLCYFYSGARWDSNPRHSEPQSDALTN